MSFFRVPVIVCRTLIVLLAGIAWLGLAGAPGYAADIKRTANVVVRPAPQATAAIPSGAELVGRLLSERATSSDPDVPLPQRNLTESEPAYAPLTGPQIYGRRDEGSVVVGLKIPIPADRGAFQ